MAKKDKPIKVLIIDDKKDYCDSLSGSARKHRIQIKSSSNLENGIQMLRDDSKYEFVILDGRAFENEDDEDSNKTVDNIPYKAKEQIDQINRENNREIGYCVNTGFVDQFAASLEGLFKVFEKDNSSSEELFEHIKSVVSNSGYRKVRRKYYDSFKPFDNGLIKSEFEFLLVNILQNLEKKDYRKRNISEQRDLLEAIFFGLIKASIIPSVFINEHGKPNQESCTRFLEGKPTSTEHDINSRTSSNTYVLQHDVPQSIAGSFRKLKNSLNEKNHLSEEAIVKFAFLSNAYTLMEVMDWMNNFLNDE